MASCRNLWAAALLPLGMFLIAPLAAHADPIQIGGSVRTTPVFGMPNTYEFFVLLLGGDRFDVPLARVPTPAELVCSPCAPDQLIDVSTAFTLAGSSLTGTAEVNGVPYHRVFGEGELNFLASPLTVPADTPSSTVYLVQPSPLTATGSLRFFDKDTSQLLFDHEVFGSGTTRLYLVGAEGGPVGAPNSFYFIDYGLAEPHPPVPEPSTLLLFGTGAVLLTRMVRRTLGA
jgi:hypothetical protein